METFTKSLMLDVEGRNRYKYVYAKQGDSGSRFVNVMMLANGVQIVPESGTTAKIRALKPDGTGVFNSATINENGTITAELTSQMLAVKGDVQADIMLVGSNNEILSTVTFYITVEEAPAGEAIESSNEFLELIELRGVATQAASDANEAKLTAQEAAASADAARIAAENAKSAYDIAVENGYSGTESEWIASLKGDKGETTLPVARASSADGIAYTATGDGLPTVSVADNMSHVRAVGKGRQIVFIPYVQNASNAPMLRLNGGEVIQIRLRAPKNQGSDDSAPDATLPVPVGALMTGVPYTLTFCGLYWLVDSMIYSGIPLPTAADAGKVLTASADGSAAWVAVTNAEEVAV